MKEAHQTDTLSAAAQRCRGYTRPSRVLWYPILSSLEGWLIPSTYRPTSVPQRLHGCSITGIYGTHVAEGSVTWTITAASHLTFNLGCSTEPTLICPYSPAPSIKPISRQYTQPITPNTRQSVSD